MLILAALLAAAPPPVPRRVVVARAAVVRVRARLAVAAVAWREKSGPQCIRATDVAGAAVVEPDAVDFFLRGGARMRARLEDECPALDYYRGFYVTPAADGRICADRDAIRTRSGGECGIDRFRRLVAPRTPAPPKP